ncbi:MAG: hypothetical protein K9L59_17650 [Desulfobacterales bacterium]|nr:hypothetical protein [Desulfobacterales bacterium]
MDQAALQRVSQFLIRVRSARIKMRKALSTKYAQRISFDTAVHTMPISRFQLDDSLLPVGAKRKSRFGGAAGRFIPAVLRRHRQKIGTNPGIGTPNPDP